MVLSAETKRKIGVCFDVFAYLVFCMLLLGAIWQSVTVYPREFSWFGWVKFVIFTAVLFGVVVRRLQNHWQQKPFLLATAALAGAHCLLFIFALRAGIWLGVGHYCLAYLVEYQILLFIFGLAIESPQANILREGPQAAFKSMDEALPEERERC